MAAKRGRKKVSGVFVSKQDGQFTLRPLLAEAERGEETYISKAKQ